MEGLSVWAVEEEGLQAVEVCTLPPRSGWEEESRLVNILDFSE